MSNRFVAENAEKIVAFLRASGEDTAAKTVAPSKSLHGGCSDPEHCNIHSGYHNGKAMLSIATSVSYTRLHKIAIELGLIPIR